VLNFSGDETNKSIADAAWSLWLRETLELVSHEVHLEALKCGYGYMIVWPDDQGQAKFYVQDSRQCVVIEDEGTSQKQFAAKQWVTDDKRVRITLYYPDRIEKFITVKARDGRWSALKADHFVPFSEGEESSTENPYGVIPMFQFETQPVLNDAIPIQDALNKTICDKLVAMEFAAFRQRWATGLEPPMDQMTGIPTLPFKAGVDRLWFTGDDKVKFGEFGATDLGQFLEVADSYRMEMALVSGTPLHYFLRKMSDAISGEALKTLESRFTKKVKRLTLNFGTVWAEAMRFALQIEGTSADAISVQWQAPEQRSEKELWETASLKADLGIPEEVIWEEAGYTKEDIKKFKRLNAANEQPDEAVLNAQRMPNETQITQTPQ
jgi:hypothetical protein